MINEQKHSMLPRAGSNLADSEPVALTDLELELVLGGTQAYQVHSSEQTNPTGNALDLRNQGQQEQYGPPAPPVSSGLDAPTGGGLPPGAPGVVQPGNARAIEAAGESLADHSGYYGRHAIAEALDFGSSWAVPPFNYLLNKGADFIRPDEDTYDEYAQNH